MKKTDPEPSGVFEQRLASLRAAHAPQFEIDAAVAVCQRLRTARAVCESVLADSYSESAVLTVLDALSDEVAALQQYAFDADPPPKGFAQ
jgi:hypothetical protein